jgi:hypothetical protein
MDKSSLSRYILNRLSSSADRNNVIQEVCLRGDLLWPDAEALVKEVEETSSREIERRQSPMVITSSLMVAAFGLILTAYAVLSMLEPVTGRVLPDLFYGMRDLEARNSLPERWPSKPISNSQSGEQMGFWDTIYRLGTTYGVSPDIISILYVIFTGYLFWPILLLGVGSIIIGSMELTKTIMRITER